MKAVGQSRVAYKTGCRGEGCEASVSFLADLCRVERTLKAKMLCRYMLLLFISECLQTVSYIYIWQINTSFVCSYVAWLEIKADLNVLPDLTAFHPY